MGGLTEQAGEGPDSFWTWRDLMYRFARHITPDAYGSHRRTTAGAECLRHGYTSICEFHYVHRQPDGAMVSAHGANCADCIILQGARTNQRYRPDHVAGAVQLRQFWRTAAACRAKPLSATNVHDDILQLIDLNWNVRRSAQVEVGAWHRTPCAPPRLSQIRELLQAGMPAERPIHIHIAEQIREVNDCITFSGERPLALLAGQLGLSPRWTLVHATHLSEEELKYLAGSGAVAGLCPTTEANLGDGLFTLPEYMAQHGRFGIGSDSHVSTSPVEELRWLEYGQRLSYQRRNISLVPGQKRVADGLWQQALIGGAQASGRRVGSLEPGKRADLLVLDADHPNLFDSEPDDRLARWLFSGNDNLVRDVMVGGQWKVRFGRHVEQPQISANYRATLAQLGKLRQHAA